MNISHMSVSRKGTWDTCKQLYKYKYHLKTPSTVPEQFYFTYGKIVHKIAEEYVGRKGEMTLEDISAQVLNGSILIENYGGNEIKAPTLPFEYKMKMPEHLSSIKKLTQQVGYDGDLEWGFEFDLNPPNNRKVVGFIDRLIQKNDKFFIIDYKTTKKGMWRKTQETIKYDLQMRTYAKVVQKTFDVPADRIGCSLYYLEGGNLISTRFTQEALDAAEKELKEAFIEIENYDPDKVWGTTGSHCKRCDYYKICPFVRR